jgi:hypothetical protein
MILFLVFLLVFQVNSTAGRWSTGEMGLWVDGKMTALGAAYGR